MHVRGRRCANEYPIIGHYDRGPVIRLITGEVAQVPYRVRCRDMLVPPTHAVGPLCLLYWWRLCGARTIYLHYRGAMEL